LQRLGLVIHISPSQNIIIKTDIIPKIGNTVFDENLRVTGRVFDVLGPTSSPYAIIKPMINEPEKLLNKRLYVHPPREDRRNKR